MSIEMHAFLPGHELPTRTAWQEALNCLDIPLELGPGPDTMVLGGFCPMVLKGENTGVEIYIDNPRDIIEIYPNIFQKISDARNVISFRWSANPREGACALGASAALIKVFDAKLFFPDGGYISTDAEDVIISMHLCCDIDS